MKSIRFFAPASLVAATVLFLATLPFSDRFLIGLLNAFAEAGMIGGLADWFAVIALFRRPFGLPIPHTAIIPTYRSTLTRGIVDTVQNVWLKKETILDRIESWQISRGIMNLLDDPENRDALLSAARTTLRESVQSLNSSRVASVFLTAAYEQMTPETSMRFARGVVNRVLNDELHLPMIDGILHQADVVLASKQSRVFLSDSLRRASQIYARTRWQKASRWLAERTHLLEYDELADSITHALRDEITNILAQKDHAFRQRIDAWISQHIDILFTDDRAKTWLHDIHDSALTSEAAIIVVTDFIERARLRVLSDLDREDSSAMQHLSHLLSDGVAHLRQNAATTASVELWAKNRLASFVETHHDEIGRLVQHNLDRLNDQQLVELIEKNIGADLQYIRVNGAIVGGAVGATLFLLKHLLH